MRSKPLRSLTKATIAELLRSRFGYTSEFAERVTALLLEAVEDELNQLAVDGKSAGLALGGTRLVPRTSQHKRKGHDSGNMEHVRLGESYAFDAADNRVTARETADADSLRLDVRITETLLKRLTALFKVEEKQAPSASFEASVAGKELCKRINCSSVRLNSTVAALVAEQQLPASRLAIDGIKDVHLASPEEIQLVRDSVHPPPEGTAVEPGELLNTAALAAELSMSVGRARRVVDAWLASTNTPRKTGKHRKISGAELNQIRQFLHNKNSRRSSGYKR